MKKLNWNYVSLGLLLVAYLWSAVRFAAVSANSESSGVPDSGRQTIRVAHWQLEPGFREGLQWVMDKYNTLPRVQEAGVHVEQTPITEKIYSQFMNVHLISGTAPDIAAKAGTRLVQGSNFAKFFAGLGEYVNEPNPYNAPEYLDPALPEETRKMLTESAWKNTFVDGMQGGYDTTLNDYYAVTVSALGSLRFFYNEAILSEGKRYIQAAVESDPQPDWLQACWLRQTPEGTKGYLPDNERLRVWLTSDEPPETLGQLILYCVAIQQFGPETDRPYMVPISGSSYSNIVDVYDPIFLSAYQDQLDLVPGTGIGVMEALAGYQTGVWSLKSPMFEEFYDFARTMTRFLPTGYLGLDREQAQRRFILGNAAIIACAGGDAAGIFAGVEKRDLPEDRFGIAISRPPVPASDERWHDYLPGIRNEASAVTGVPLAINKNSANFDWALDFLKFLTSQPMNQEFSERSAWLPATLGSSAPETMKPFMPVSEGFPSGNSIQLNSASGGLKTIFTGQLKLVFDGGLDPDEFADQMDGYLRDPALGIPAYWKSELQRGRDTARALDRTIAVEEFRTVFNDDEEAASRLKPLMLDSVTRDEGIETQVLWHHYHPDQPRLDSGSSSEAGQGPNP